MRVFPGTALLILAFTMFAGTASAQTDEDESPPAARWYGWQTLLVDTASVSTVVARLSLKSLPAVEAGLAGYALGAPIVHAAHGQWGHALSSVGLHVGVPTAAGLTGFAIGAATCSSHAWLGVCEGTAAGVGVMLSGVIVPLLDAGNLGYEPVNDAKAISVAPSVVVAKNGASFTLGGRF